MIDDDPMWCEQVCQLLEPSGYNVVAAASEAAALQSLAEMKVPSAIFVEPKTATGAFCRMLRDMPQLNGVPMFLISAAPARDVYERGAGANGYVRKAVALDHLMLLLGNTPEDGASRRRTA